MEENSCTHVVLFASVLTNTIAVVCMRSLQKKKRTSSMLFLFGGDKVSTHFGLSAKLK